MYSMRYLLFVFATFLAYADISDATVEITGVHRYRVTFNMESSDAPVSIFSANSPDQIEDTNPSMVTQTSPADVELPRWSGRVYFRLKTVKGKTRVVSVRRLPLEGQDNFRDLGGYRTQDGRYVRWGRLYRSGQLAALTEQDYEYLRPLGIRLICDFRADQERRLQTTHWPGNAPEFFLTPIGMDESGRNARLPELKRLVEERAPAEQMRAFIRRLYPEMPFTAAPQFARVLNRLLSAHDASMIHCSAGKDRTGVFSALFLLTMGVPRETVIEDYLLTNRYVLADDKIAHSAVAYQKLLGLEHVPPTEVIKPVMSVERSYIESTLDAIEKRHGTFDEYRRNVLHFSDADVENLRARYLEP